MVPQNIELKDFFATIVKERCYTTILEDYNIILVFHILGVILQIWNWILGFKFFGFLEF
jgi:hypothetical protein